ncbi:MAG: NAD-dependent epimerase/dehydratase family protein, partial [Gammaproteobacteria bacterium]|nr:NAD-dependent epimerase/dehydratase family protein [Gammaproteobacteria bacterium]
TLDATDPAAVRAATRDCDGVVNCLAGDADTIVGSARAIYSAAAAGSPRPRVVHLSSMAVYGTASGTLDERAPLRADLGPYSAAKVAAEAGAMQAADSIILRPGIVYGPGSAWWTDRIARLLLARRLGDLGAAGNGCCNLVHVDDLAAAIIAALRLPAAGTRIYNIAAPGAPSWNDYFARFAAALGLGPVRRIGPIRLAFELRAVGPALKLVELASLLAQRAQSDARPPIRPWLVALCRQALRLDTQAANRDLAPHWTDLDAGLEACARWFHQTRSAQQRHR